MSAGIALRVVTSAGDAHDGAVVTVMSMTGDQVARVESGTDGSVTVDGLAPGTYTAVVTSPGFEPQARVALVSATGTARLGSVTLVRSGSGPLPSPGEWVIDPQHSTIEISVRHLGISSVKGRFDEFSGSITVADPIEKSAVDVEIKVASIDTGNQMRDGHLRSDGFFDVERHPVARFRSGVVTGPVDDVWTVKGALELRGSAVPVDLRMTYLGETEDPWGGTRLGFRASTELRRGDFGISFDEKLLTGVAQIGSTARLDLEVQAVRADSVADT
ncbi:YceI family protein [Tsukamurella sp. 8F]|uniref:YceI family protein n=1 Tax=unclassified Tsukamurella TaxID=2633480 RepID=UPI0023BA074F|nr:MULTISPECIES: YceI family protein [unclassified Tsukamurella]MDF0531856.1 YceI family protein [Tsukamurella sp. 8J]MDF0589066.1 YceI family protein [Tsukamurella sp. 8F]